MLMRMHHHRSRPAASAVFRAGAATATASAGSVLHQVRAKSYVLKFVRGHLPNDLKDVQGAIGCLYGELPDADEYGAYRMPQNYIETYRQLGYAVMPHPVLSPEQVDLLADEAQQLADDREHHPKMDLLYATSLNSLKDTPLFYCQGQWRACWAMHDLIMMPHLAVPSSQLLGNVPVRLWYDEVIAKKGRVGPCLPWQQNYQRWQHTNPINHVTVMIALDTLTKDRGAPCVVPGSHVWRDGELFPPVAYDEAKDESQVMSSLWEITNEEEQECLMDTPPQTINLQRGQAMFLHPRLLYATHGNRSLDWSRCLFVHYMGDGTMTTHAGPLLPKTTRFPPGALIQGPYYPVAFDPSMMDDALPAPPTAEIAE
jgi:hypothetical protein